jgi:cation transport protein ChaC
MWVFGYGSLMWESWEAGYGCLRRVTAVLPGFRRAFDKASVRNWGTKERPGPTLNLAIDAGNQCKGFAFEFPDAKRRSITAALADREGMNFELKEREVALEGGDRVLAVTPRYMGPNLIGNKPLAERASMARLAVGTHGNCADYVKAIADKLTELGIDDPAVREFWEAIRQGDQRSAEPAATADRPQGEENRHL